MACTFVLLVTISYYFGKQEATLKIKENKTSEIKDICIHTNFVNRASMTPLVTHIVRHPNMVLKLAPSYSEGT